MTPYRHLLAILEDMTGIGILFSSPWNILFLFYAIGKRTAHPHSTISWPTPSLYVITLDLHSNARDWLLRVREDERTG